MTFDGSGRREYPRIVAHRGVSAHFPENTRAAFEAAVSIGADAIECDLQLTADDRIVVCHDPSLERFGHAGVDLTNATLPQLRNVDIGSSFAPEFHDERLVTLDELLKEFGSRLPLLLELKTESLSPDRVKVMVRCIVDVLTPDRNRDTCLILCFDDQILRRVCRRASWAQLVLNTHLPQQIHQTYLVRRPWLTAINSNILQLDESVVRTIHQQKRKVFCFTCNSVEDVIKARDLSVDALHTDDPDHARQILRVGAPPVHAMAKDQSVPSKSFFR